MPCCTAGTTAQRVTGLKLAVIPVAIGLLAPLGIALSHRWGMRAVGVIGMALCLAALLIFVAIGFWFEYESLVPGLTGMFVFGAGLGLFMAPNSNATIAAAPSQHSGTAAGMVNLMRVLGSCIGVSAASSMMAWRLEQRGGRDSLDVLFERPRAARRHRKQSRGADRLRRDDRPAVTAAAARQLLALELVDNDSG